VHGQFAWVKPDAMIRLGHLYKQSNAGEQSNRAAERMFEFAMQIDPEAMQRFNRWSQKQADQLEDNQTKATDACSGLLSLRNTPMRGSIQGPTAKDWSTCDEMAASVLFNFASPSKKAPPRVSPCTKPSHDKKTTAASPQKFAVYQDRQAVASPLPPRMPLGRSRWPCKAEGCGEDFSTRELLRSHCKESGHPQNDKGEGWSTKSPGKHALSPQHANAMVPSKRQAIEQDGIVHRNLQVN